MKDITIKRTLQVSLRAKPGQTAGSVGQLERIGRIRTDERKLNLA